MKLRVGDLVVVATRRPDGPDLVVREVSGFDRSRENVRRHREVGDDGPGLEAISIERVYTLGPEWQEPARRLAAEHRAALDSGEFAARWRPITTVDEMRAALRERTLPHP